MMDNAVSNAYMDKLVEYYKDCTNDRKEIVASPCYKLEYQNQSEEQILFSFLKNKFKSTQQNNHANGHSINDKLRATHTPKPTSDDENEDSYHNRINSLQTSSDLTFSNRTTLSQSRLQESLEKPISQNPQNSADNKPGQASTRGKELLAALRNKGKVQKEAEPRPVSPSSSSNNLAGSRTAAQTSSNHQDDSYLKLDNSNLDLDKSRIEDPAQDSEDILMKSTASNLTLEGDYPDSREKERLLKEDYGSDLLSKTIRQNDHKESERMAQRHEQRIENENKDQREEEKQEKPLGESAKRSRAQELRREHFEKAERKKLEEARLREEEIEKERLRKEKEEREKREQEEFERRKRELEEERARERARELERERAREIAREREEEKARLDAQIKAEREERDRQKKMEEQLRKEEEEEEERERERQRELKKKEEEKEQFEQSKRRVQQEEEERNKRKMEARKFADEITNQREVIDSVRGGLREELNETSKQHPWPTYGDRTIPQNMQNSFSFQNSFQNGSQQDPAQMSPNSQSSRSGKEERFEGTTSLLNEIKEPTRKFQRDSRQGSTVDSTETRDRFDGRSVGGQRTIPDRLKRIEELLEKVLENQINLEKRLDKIERVQDEQIGILEDVRDNLV